MMEDQEKKTAHKLLGRFFVLAYNLISTANPPL